MDTIMNFVSDPMFYIVVTGLLAVIRAIGELFEKIGAAKEGDDWFDSAGSFLLKLVGNAGKFLNFIGLGNKQRK